MEHPRNGHYEPREPEKEPDEKVCEGPEPELSMQELENLQARSKKARDIREACMSQDVEELIRHATSEGGLLEDELRQIACKSSHPENQGRKSHPTVSQGLLCYNVTRNFKHSIRPIARSFRATLRKTRLNLT